MNYFLVSVRYNRKNLEDYGLVYKDGKYIDPMTLSKLFFA